MKNRYLAFRKRVVIATATTTGGEYSGSIPGPGPGLADPSADAPFTLAAAPVAAARATRSALLTALPALKFNSANFSGTSGADDDAGGVSSSNGGGGSGGGTTSQTFAAKALLDPDCPFPLTSLPPNIYVLPLMTLPASPGTPVYTSFLVLMRVVRLGRRATEGDGEEDGWEREDRDDGKGDEEGDAEKTFIRVGVGGYQPASPHVSFSFAADAVPHVRLTLI